MDLHRADGPSDTGKELRTSDRFRAAVADRDRPRILIARMSAIGDTILTMPVACAIREKYPQATIGWVVEKGASTVLRGHECIDDMIVLERGWFTSPRVIWNVRQQLRQLRFEVAVDCQSITKTALACWLSGAPLRIGCRGQYGCELSPWLNNQLIEPQRPHLTDRSLELLAPLGIHNPAVDWKYPLEQTASASMALAIRDLGLQAGYAVINPGATWDSKLWEMDRFAAVARDLGESHGLPTLVVWGGQRELNWAEQIVSAAGGHARLAPRSTLAELAALIQGGRIFISADTGPLHMAVAIGTPSVGLYGATRPADCGPYGSPHRALQVRFHEGSRRERRQATNTCMQLITVEMVTSTCADLLADTATARHATARQCRAA
ncbi:MAG: glycosyltransferase family 9 protein [Planctomycetota bacterium]